LLSCKELNHVQNINRTISGKILAAAFVAKKELHIFISIWDALYNACIQYKHQRKDKGKSLSLLLLLCEVNPHLQLIKPKLCASIVTTTPHRTYRE
jgi:hypothetical protein